MRRTFALLTCLSFIAVSCLNEMENDPFLTKDGEGRIAVAIQAESGMLTRAELDTDAFLVSVKRGSNTLIDAQTYSTLTTEYMIFPVGSGYTVSAESCTETAAEVGYGKPRIAGTSPTLTLKKDETTQATVHCTPVNAGVRVTATEDFNALFSSYEMKVELNNRELTFTTSNPTTVGYYNVPAEGATLAYSLTATRKAGGEPATQNATALLEKGKISQLTLNTTGKGTINLTITYDDSFATEYIDLTIDTEEDNMEVDPTQETNMQLVKHI